MARRMSTRAGMRSGEQLTSEDAAEATAGEKAEELPAVSAVSISACRKAGAYNSPSGTLEEAR
jgi:hypothetical protein